MSEWIQNNYIEVIGACLALVYLILQIKQKWTMWLICLISSGFYIYIFFNAKLYAEMGLNVYFAIMSFYGLYCWLFVKTKDDKLLEVNSITLKTGMILIFVGIIIFGGLSWTLIHLTDSHVPYPDAGIASLSIIATWMLAKKIIQQWFVWLIADSISVVLYIHQGLYPTAILFSIYIAMIFVGYNQWKKSMNQTA